MNKRYFWEHAYDNIFKKQYDHLEFMSQCQWLYFIGNETFLWPDLSAGRLGSLSQFLLNFLKESEVSLNFLR